MPIPTLEQVAELKRQLAGAKKLDEVVTYFFDNFADNPDFHQVGYPREEIPRQLQDAVIHVVDALWEGKPVAMRWMIIDIPTMGFMHGTIIMNGKLATVIWAPDILVGLLAITLDPASSRTTFARISITPASQRKAAN
ncbi:MAG: hypothetical protein U0Q16_24850 [Bryobacteraceae bacterium]